MDIDPKLLETLGKNPNSVAALSEWVNKDSDFQQHSEEQTIARKFYADPNKNKRIYHYTDMDNLDSILKSNSFYLGSINDMNDPMEVKYTYNLAKEILKSLGATATELAVFNQDYKKKNLRFGIVDSPQVSYSPKERGPSHGNFTGKTS